LQFNSTSAAVKVTTFDKYASGDIYNILFDNIHIYDSNRGIAIMPRWGSGNVYNVTFSNIWMETRYFSNPWWGSAEPIYVTSLSESSLHPWTGYVSNISFVNITAKSENSIVLFGKERVIDGISLKRVNITITQFTNYSRPSHDWRPAPAPDLVYAATDGIFMDGVSHVLLSDTIITFAKPHQPFWGTCFNFTNTKYIERQNLDCITT